jgi:hypothetical protein
MRNAAAGDNESNTPESLSSPPANGLSDYFFVAEGCLPYCPSAPFARQVQASRPPLLRMLSLRIGPLLAPLSVWRRPLSVDTCPPMMACRFGALEQPPHLSSCSSYMSTALISGVMTRPKSRARRGKSRAAARSPGGSRRCRCASELSADGERESNLPKLTCYVLTFSSSAHTRRTSRGAPYLPWRSKGYELLDSLPCVFFKALRAPSGLSESPPIAEM